MATFKINSRINIYSNNKTNILLLVPDGTGIKNYLYSSVFVKKEISLCLYHNFDEDTLTEIQQNISFSNQLEIPAYRESPKEKFLRELIHLCRIKWNIKQTGNKTIHQFYKPSKNTAKKKLFYKWVEIQAKRYKSYDAILKLETKYQKLIRKNPFYGAVKEQLQQQKIDVLFCTHQRALKAPIIFAVANDLGIKTTTVIFSWDNIPKARLALQADQYLVWSQYMKDELMVMYPELDDGNIKITGTPQFEFYKKKDNIIPKFQFYKKYGLDQKKKIICFSGDDVLTSPYDPLYLDDLATSITTARLDRSLQIVFRRCPVDVSGRYDWVLRKHSNLIVDIPPLWNFNSEIWSAVYPTFEDVKLLVSLTYYADVVVNVGSTMAFDFGMFNKPCIFINYDTVEDTNWSVNTIYQFQHFKSMPVKEAVYWFNNKAEIAKVLQKTLTTPLTKIDDWFDIVVEDAKKASQTIIKTLTS